MKTISGTSNYVIETCCTCNMEFGMTKEFQEKRLADKKSFYCPSGHSQYYIGEPEEKKLRRIISDRESEIAKLKRQLKSKGKK
jgi:hypothetical protein